MGEKEHGGKGDPPRPHAGSHCGDGPMIAQNLLDHLAPEAKERTITDLRIGIRYTAVQLDDGGCGVAFTFRDEISHASPMTRRAGSFLGTNAYEIAGLAVSPDLVGSVIGMATLTALVDHTAYRGEPGDVRQIVRIERDDTVGMVGMFRPMLKSIEEKAGNLYVFERKPGEHPGVYPDWSAPMLLPECDVVILSATTIPNKTIDHLMDRCTRARSVAVVGPSCPLVPEAFEGTRVTHLAGAQVMDADAVLRIVSEGGGTREFAQVTRKINVNLVE